MKEQKLSAFNKCKDIYFEWHTEKFFYPKFDGSDGKGLKELINYLFTLTPDEPKVVDTFSYVLQNWDSLPKFYRENTRLRQINSNIHNIIHFFKNETRTGVSREYLEQVVRDMREAD